MSPLYATAMNTCAGSASKVDSPRVYVQVRYAGIARPLQLISEKLEIVSRSGQSLKRLESLVGCLVQLNKALLQACDGWMGEAVEN